MNRSQGQGGGSQNNGGMMNRIGEAIESAVDTFTGKNGGSKSKSNNQSQRNNNR